LIRINEAQGAEKNKKFHTEKDALNLIIHKVQQKNSKMEASKVTITAKLQAVVVYFWNQNRLKQDVNSQHFQQHGNLYKNYPPPRYSIYHALVD
jgi:cell fate regulator YaaT (PSP1 superfamily)